MDAFFFRSLNDPKAGIALHASFHLNNAIEIQENEVFEVICPFVWESCKNNFIRSIFVISVDKIDFVVLKDMVQGWTWNRYVNGWTK